MNDITLATKEEPSWREKIGIFVESTWVRNFIIVLILINGIILGLDTSPYFLDKYGNILHTIDAAILYVFVIELSLKLIAFDVKFFRSGWNIFDFFIVGIALFPNSGTFSVLRVFRIFRLLRAISVVTSFRLVIESLLHSIPGIASIVGLLLVLYYIFSVIATTLFGHDFPELFGSLGKTMYSLFQVMTLEGWSMEVARPIMKVFPNSWIFFISFILVTSFAMMNLFVAVIVDTMQNIRERHKEECDKKIQQISVLQEEIASEEIQQVSVLQGEISSLRAEILELKMLIQNNNMSFQK